MALIVGLSSSEVELCEFSSTLSSGNTKFNIPEKLVPHIKDAIDSTILSFRFAMGENGYEVTCVYQKGEKGLEN